MAKPSNISEIVEQAANDVLAGKLIGYGKKNKGLWDGKEVSGLCGTPQGIISFARNNLGTDYFGFLTDGDNLLPFTVDVNDLTGYSQRLASLLKVAEQKAEPITVGGKLNSTEQKMYELKITSASFGGIELRRE